MAAMSSYLFFASFLRLDSSTSSIVRPSASGTQSSSSRVSPWGENTRRTFIRIGTGLWPVRTAISLVQKPSATCKTAPPLCCLALPGVPRLGLRDKTLPATLTVAECVHWISACDHSEQHPPQRARAPGTAPGCAPPAAAGRRTGRPAPRCAGCGCSAAAESQRQTGTLRRPCETTRGTSCVPCPSVPRQDDCECKALKASIRRDSSEQRRHARLLRTASGYGANSDRSCHVYFVC